MKYRILNGNELLIQGAREAGFSLYTGYPGSPLADFFNVLNRQKNELKKKGIQVVIANSEANAAAMASGAKMAGQDTLIAMKSMGLHVASDALSVGNFANPGPTEIDEDTGETLHPGVVVAVGDDPWSISTSTPADSRYLFQHLHIPFLEPSHPQELKDWMKKALLLSKRSSVYIGVLLTTYMAEGGGRVLCGDIKDEEKKKITLDPDEFNLQKNVMVPPNSLRADRAMIQERFPKVMTILDDLGLDKSYGEGQKRIGVISTGVVFETVKQIFDTYDLYQHCNLFKLACSYPLGTNKLKEFLKSVDSIIVIEEKRDFLENELKGFLHSEDKEFQVVGKKIGKEDGFPAFGGLNFENISSNLQKAFQYLEVSIRLENLSSLSAVNIPKRLPTFCPGCPHRETLSLLKDLRKTLKDKDVNLISHGDVGCYSLSFLEPFKEMHDLSAMGQGGALAAGTDLFTTNPSVVLMGDSTFFHSGISAVSNSVQCGHDITYILLDNDNTAMTGHQMTPRTGVSVDGEARPRQNILEAVRSMGVSEVIEVNPSDRYFYKNLLLDTVQKRGTKVIVSNKECALTFHGRKKKEDRRHFDKGQTKDKVFYQINTLACEDCRVCVDMTGCPGLSQTFDAYGTKVEIDPQICVNDSYCTKLKACPSFEMVKVNNYHPTQYQKEHELKPNKFPDPSFITDLKKIAGGDIFRSIVIGVGGSGVTTISRVLAEAAGHMGGREDLDFKFVDQKGLAQRNGSVMSHLALFPSHQSHGQTNPLGSCKLIFAPDLLEGARAIPYLSGGGVLITDSDFQIPLTILLDRGEKEKPLNAEALRKELEEKLGDQIFHHPFKNISFELFGKSVYSSTMILGFAFQKGFIPFSAKDMEKALLATIPTYEHETNLKAFSLGRHIALNEEEAYRDILKNEESGDFLQSLEESCSVLESSNNILSSFRKWSQFFAAEYQSIPLEFWQQYIHDALLYDRKCNLQELKQGLEKLSQFYKKENLNFSVAVRTYFKTYWIKDEVFVAHLMIGPIARKRDRDKWNKLGSKFSKTYINRPKFSIGSYDLEFNFSPKPWMLRIFRHLRFLRIFLKGWHQKEKSLALRIRKDLLLKPLSYSQLMKLDNIKGYREVRYGQAEKKFKELSIENS